MLLRQLQYLSAIASERHFGRAAAACHVSQPALSAGLQRLEAELGVTLIRRGHHFEGLTEDGEALLPWVRATLAASDGLVTEAARLRGGITGTLRLGVTPTTQVRIGELLSPFVAEHPQVSRRVSTRTADGIIDALLAHELEAGLLYLGDGLPGALHATPLYEDRLVLLTSDPHWHGRAGEASWAQAAELPLGLLEPGMQKRRIVDRAFHEAGVEPRPVVEADSVAALVEFGLAGGSCVVAEAWLDGRTLPSGARVHPLIRPVVAPTVALATRTGPLASPLARALREALAATPVSAAGSTALGARAARRWW